MVSVTEVDGVQQLIDHAVEKVLASTRETIRLLREENDKLRKRLRDFENDQVLW